MSETHIPDDQCVSERLKTLFEQVNCDPEDYAPLVAEVVTLEEQLMKSFGIWPDGSNVHAGHCSHADEREQHEESRAVAVEQYWKDKQGDEYGSY